MKIRDYTKIEAWKLADDLVVEVYQCTKLFPREELYGLTNQLRRAACSAAANIVEGASRDSKKDYLHFLYMARGSLGETQYFIHLARRLGYIEDPRQPAEQARRAFACLHGLILAVEKEAGTLSRTVAKLTSIVVIGFTTVISNWAPRSL